jgi:hypothetical protein
MRYFVLCVITCVHLAFGQSSRLTISQHWQPYVNLAQDRDTVNAWSFYHARSCGVLSPARFLAVDPLADKFPAWSPYHYSGNNPTVFLDPTGKEWYHYQAEGQKAAQWNYHKDTQSMTVWNGGYNEDGRKTMELQKGIVELLAFNGSQLDWHQAEGGTQSWPAVSGVVDANGNTQPNLQAVANQGPIPEGWYTADPAQIQRWSDLSIPNRVASTFSKVWEVASGNKAGAWPGGLIAWGEIRLPLSPAQVGNRSNFFIHGGLVPGSAGCIDLTKHNNAFFKTFAGHGASLPLSVRYGGL